MLVNTPSFKSFGMTGINQELSMLTHIMKDCVIMQINTTSDLNIAKVQPSFLKQFLPRFRTILDVIKSRIKFLGPVIFLRLQPLKQRDYRMVLTKREGSNLRK